MNIEPATPSIQPEPLPSLRIRLFEVFAHFLRLGFTAFLVDRLRISHYMKKNSSGAESGSVKRISWTCWARSI